MNLGSAFLPFGVKMNELGMKIKHPKRRGEWVELRFMARASEYGLCVSKPWGDSAHYDFVVEVEGHLLRVQVKSTASKKRVGYACAVRDHNGPYPSGAFDFLAAYIVPTDLWYIIPGDRINACGSILLSPELPNSKYERFREAWRLLTREPAFQQDSP